MRHRTQQRNTLTTLLTYIAVSHGPLTADHCARFVDTYHRYPPGIEHDTLVCCNGGILPTSVGLILSPLNPMFLIRKNDGGWDVSAYIDVARHHASGYDAIVCLGESVYFHRPDWLLRLAEAWDEHGPGMYGPFASHIVRAHMNTTAFACAPDLLANYRWPVRSHKDRYEFEHGIHALWRGIHARRKPVFLVTFDGEYAPGHWRDPPDILWRGDQSNCLMLCNHTDRWANASPANQTRWSHDADQPFR